MYIQIMLLFVFTMAVSYYVYSNNFDKLAVRHHYAKVVDTLVLFGASGTIIAAILLYDSTSNVKYLLWMQLLFAMSSMNIHISRFIISYKTK